MENQPLLQMQKEMCIRDRCRLKDINMVFTDDQVPLEAKDAMEQNGIIVETVPR